MGETGTAPDQPTPAAFSPNTLQRVLIALFSGAVAPLAFSPNNVWLLEFVSVMGLYLALKFVSPRQGAVIGWIYGAGFFGVGASWVYVSIHVYGNAGEFFAGLLTALFVAGLALFFALQCWLLQRFFNRPFYLFSFSAIWILGEWFRGWFLTGFPWLYLGYPHVDSGFAGIAPIFGVMGISLIVVITGAAFGEMTLAWYRTRSLYAVAGTYLPTGLFFLWIAASLTRGITWVEATDDSLSVGIVQANIDQLQKFDDAFIQQNVDLYDTLSDPLWESDIVVWPETAIPFIYDPDGSVVNYFDTRATQSNTSLITGIFGRTETGLHNSITSLGDGSGIYHKQKLVPFGEYVPLRALFSTLLQLFDLPMSSLTPGPSGQPLLTAAGFSVSPFICYEVVYPDFVRRRSRDADFLVTISNDTWFGASWGPLQHLQMAAMRALENGRWMVRSTNNGVSAIIDDQGNIIVRSRQFQADVLQGEIQIMQGRTPFSRWGSWPVLIFCVLLLVASLKLDAQRIKDKLRRLKPGKAGNA